MPSRPSTAAAPPALHTIGHGNRGLAAFLALLAEAGVRRVVDVRRHPVSRRHPHFARRALAGALADAGLDYVHMEDLGGRRPLPAGLPADVAGLRDPGLRAYAVWAQGPRFAAALARLIRLAAERPTAILCAEVDPARCHRRVLTDHLLARGVRVLHILAPGRIVPATPSPEAEIRGGRVRYPPPVPDLFGG